MLAWLNDLMANTAGFMPHGNCYLWLPSILGLHVISDATIAFSYFSIPFALLYFVHKRADLEYRWVFVLFGAFILLCGTTHLMSIWTIWHPDYWLDGFIKLATALVSIITALLIWPLIPKLLQLPSPQALQTSETYIRAIFNATPDAMLISNEQGIITMVNQQIEHLLGYMPHELVGQSIEILVPERFRTGHFRLRAEYSTSTIPKTLNKVREILALKKDGSEIDVDISLSPIQTAQGLFFASALRDITFRKQIAGAVLASEERFRRMANNSPVMIWVADANGDFSFINQAWRNLTGIDAGQSPYEEWFKTVHSDDKGAVFIGSHQHVQSNVPFTTEYRILGADRTWHWLLDTGIPTFDEKGVFSGYIGSAIDITERKQDEVNLRIAATAFESQEAVIITDANHEIIRVNTAFTESTGYTADEAVGQTRSLLNSGHHDEDFFATIWEHIQHTGKWQGEVWDKRKNGEIYPNLLTISAVKGDGKSVTHYVCTHVDITERKAAEEEIKQLAFYDPLTRLPNRRLLQERLRFGIEKARRQGNQLAVLMLDLDRFKLVNDSQGHQAGDILLLQVAERIKAQLRAVDMVARLGGDEFVVVLEDINQPEDIVRVAERILAELNKSFQPIQSHDVWIGVSIGISLYPQHADHAEILLNYADAALYQAKGQGRGCFCYYSESLTHSARERIALERRLRNAITQGDLRVFFQPQIDILTDRIIGAEALVRWQDTDEGIIPPERFIPIAEETNLIVAIGEWVLNETCNQGRKWLDMGLPAINLAVNVSAQQFKRSDINALVTEVLAKTGFPAAQLELEITESGLMENQENAIGILNNLHGQGVRLAIDDFGTGYSSLIYLKRFPLDVLKIDKGFIDEIPHNKDDMEIAATIMAMGQTLGFKVLAEGVETPEQLAFLREKGCDTYQGYIKSCPIPIDDFTVLLQSQLQSS